MTVEDNGDATGKGKTRHRRVPITPGMFTQKIDEAKVAQALEFLKAERAKSGKNKLDEALAIGDHIYGAFFQRSPQSYTHKGRNSPSLRALMAHPEFEGLGLSRSTIANYITVTIQRDRFENSISKGKLAATVRTLGFTQRLRLATCKKHSDELRIATEAVAEGLSPGEVKQRVQDANAGNAGRPGVPRPPESEIVRAIKQVCRMAHELHGLDLTTGNDDALGSLVLLSGGTSKVLGLLVDRAEAEMASRPGVSPPKTSMNMFAANTADELDDLMVGFFGESLGLGHALRDDAAKLVEYHGAQIVAHLVSTDRKVAQDWLVGFVATVAAQLDAVDLVGAKLGFNPGQTQPRGSARAKPRRTWYAIQSHAKIPDGFDTEPFLSGAYSPLVTRKCIVQASDPQDAVRLFEQQAAGFDADLDDPDKVVEVKLLSRLLPTRTTITWFISLPRSERWPTLAEYVKQPGSPRS